MKILSQAIGYLTGIQAEEGLPWVVFVILGEGPLLCWAKGGVGGSPFLCGVAAGPARKELPSSRKPVLRECHGRTSLSTLQFPPEASPLLTIGCCAFKKQPLLLGSRVLGGEMEGS